MSRRLALAVIALNLATTANAQDLVETGADPVEGKALFMEFCATCHGIDATGDGPMNPALVLQPTNLTLLQAGNGGTFPVSRVVMRIDGRDPLVSHGSPMPVFGEFFEGNDTAMKTDTGQPILTSQPVVDLIAWLKTIQE